MTADELKGIEVHVDELAALVRKNRAKSQVENAIADKIIEKYGEQFAKDVADNITLEEVRQLVMEKMANEIIEEWRTK